MLIMGGRIHPWNITETLYAYSYNCNQWINLMSDSIEKVGPFPSQTYAQAMTIEPDGDAIYVIGGWGIDTQSTVLRIELPIDLCNLWVSRFTCSKIRGCGYCINQVENRTVAEICHSNSGDCPLPESQTRGDYVYVLLTFFNVFFRLVSNQGKICSGTAPTNNCSALQDCVSCTQHTFCSWCGVCTSNDTCNSTPLSKCPYNKCQTTDCIQCNRIQGCDWSYSKDECEQCKLKSEWRHILRQFRTTLSMRIVPYRGVRNSSTRWRHCSFFLSNLIVFRN